MDNTTVLLKAPFVPVEAKLMNDTNGLKQINPPLTNTGPQDISMPTTSPAAGEDGENPWISIGVNRLPEYETSSTPQPLSWGEEENTPKDRACVVFRQWDEMVKDFRDTNAPWGAAKKDNIAVDRAFTYRKVLSPDGITVNSSELDIEDPTLWTTVKNTVEQVYPASYRWSWSKPSLTIPSPFKILVHSYDKLNEFAAADDGNDDNQKKHKEDVLLLATVREREQRAY
jgi:hypothetical protein